MRPTKQEVEAEKGTFNVKLIGENSGVKNALQNEFCPDCSSILCMEGRCRFCAYCG